MHLHVFTVTQKKKNNNNNNNNKKAAHAKSYPVLREPWSLKTENENERISKIRTESTKQQQLNTRLRRTRKER